jgi:hypothetical protein
MENQSRMQKYGPRRERMFTVLDAADADRKAVEAPAATSNLWRQIDRWVNEGGAGGDSTTPFAPERIVDNRKLSKQFGSRGCW